MSARRSSSTPASWARCRLALCGCSPAMRPSKLSRLTDGADPNHDSDIGRIVYTFRRWRGELAPLWWDESDHGEWVYHDIPGFCKAETIAGIKRQAFVLTPGGYVGAEEQDDDAEPFTEKYPRLLAELKASFAEGERLTTAVRARLESIASTRNRQGVGPWSMIGRPFGLVTSSTY